jgi:hypothetical protein
MLLLFLQTFRHGFPFQPTAIAFDPVQHLLAVGTKTGSLRLYPFMCSWTSKCTSDADERSPLEVWSWGRSYLCHCNISLPWNYGNLSQFAVFCL